MATAVITNPDLECSICMEVFITPKMLSCGHSFCRDCLERWIDGRNGTFLCPFCKQNIKIPRGGVDKFPTNFSLKTLTDSTSHKPKHYCPNHSKKEVDYYCQTCNSGLCSKCIYKDHKNHKTLDLELDSTRENFVHQLSKHEQFLKNKIEDLEQTRVKLLETSEKLKSFCDEACRKISAETEKIIGELKENCVKIQQEIRDHFDKNKSQLAKTRQKVMTQIESIETDLDASRPTTEKPTLTLIYALPKLQELQKLCENMKTDIPKVTYVEWREGSVKVCDILGSTVTKPLYISRGGSGPITTLTKPLYQFIMGSGPISTVTRLLYQSSEGSGPIPTETKPLYQSSEGSRPISTVTKPVYQTSEGSGPITTLTKPVYQSSEGSGPISTVTKPLYISRGGSGPITTLTKPLYQSSEGSRPISTVTKPLYQFIMGIGHIVSTITKLLYKSSKGNVFTFNYKDIERDYYSEDKCKSQGVVWSCRVWRSHLFGCLYIDIKLLKEDNPRVKSCTIKYTVTLVNKDKDKNVISETRIDRFTPCCIRESVIGIQRNKLTDPSEGFIDNEGQFLVKFDILQVVDVEYK